MRRLASAFGVLLALLSGCASTDRETLRATQGPTADQIHLARFLLGYGREPTWEEDQAWKAEFERRLSAYVARNPELRTSPRLSELRVERRVSVGMTRGEVTLLLEQPLAVRTDEAAMKAAAGTFWPEVAKRQPRELWVYPQGWHLFFDADHVADITVTGRDSIESLR